MGNTPSTLPDGTPVPTKEEMREAEDQCAECDDRSCDVLEYPSHISMRIHRNYVLNNSGKLHRWHIVVHSGIPASKWPRDIGKEPGYVHDVLEATKKLSAAEGTKTNGAKFSVSLIPLGPQSNCNPEEATDITIFPEFVRYHNVERENIENVLAFHTAVIAPRHQALKYYQSDPTQHPKPESSVLSEEELAKLAELGPWKVGRGFEDESSDETQPRRSQFLHDADRLNYGVGSTLPVPMDISQHTIVLLCGHTIRDKRCGVTAPILREQMGMVLDKQYPEQVDQIYIDLVSHVCCCFGFLFYTLPNISLHCLLSLLLPHPHLTILSFYHSTHT